MTASIGYSALAIAAGIVVVGAVQHRLLTTIFEWLPLRLAGRYSYSAYLIHPLVIWALLRYLLPGPGRRLLVLTPIITFALAALSWHFFEAPLLSFKRFFTDESVPQSSGHDALVALDTQPSSSASHTARS